MKLPLKTAPSGTPWSVWRKYNGTVWKRTILHDRGWYPGLFALVMLTYSVIFSPGRWILLYFGLLMVWQGVLFGASLGRNYQQLDHFIGHQMAWQQAQQEIHQRLLAEGVPQDEADQLIWQMDLNMHMQQHPEGDQ